MVYLVYDFRTLDVSSLPFTHRKDDCTALGSVANLHCLDVSREGGRASGLSPVEMLPGDLELRHWLRLSVALAHASLV